MDLDDFINFPKIDSMNMLSEIGALAGAIIGRVGTGECLPVTQYQDNSRDFVRGYGRLCNQRRSSFQIFRG